MTKQNVFDLKAASESKRRGMDLATSSRTPLLLRAREIAREIALKCNGTCDADQVGIEMLKQGYSPAALGNAAGSIFRSTEWVFTGERRRSSKIKNHSREIKVWRLRYFPEDTAA